MKQLLLYSLIFLLSACTSPVYQETTYGIEDFVADSSQISRGKFAILALKKRSGDSAALWQESCEETLLDGDEVTLSLYHPRRPDYAQAIQNINNKVGFRVCDGKMNLPHLGSIEVDGLTLNQLKQTLQNAYQQELPGSKIFVDFKRKKVRAVQIIGGARPMVEIDANTRLSEVIAKAVIPPHSNLFKSLVIREGEELPIDLYRLIHEGDEKQNIVMHDGDQIFIAQGSDAAVMVTGEVLKPKVIPVPYGFIPLREAIAIAGGIPFTASQRCIGVIRGDFIRPKIYCLNWCELEHVSNQSSLLMPGDVVVLSEKPITQWNRFIDQLQPNLGTMQTTYNLYELIRNHP